MAPVTPRGRGGSFRSRGGRGGGRGGSRGGGRGGRGYDEGPPAEIVGESEKVVLLVGVIFVAVVVGVDETAAIVTLVVTVFGVTVAVL